jgi:two-component system cell cycle response regulator DivK
MIARPGFQKMSRVPLAREGSDVGCPIILLVDDFNDALEMYREYLAFNGYRVVTARSGQEALDVAKANLPTLIFMDLRMPHMSGTEALHLLRSDPTFRTVPIIAFTAHALEDERLKALRDGFDEVISKPCLPDDLAAAIERLLARTLPRIGAPRRRRS